MSENAEWDPSEPEPFYQPTGDEQAPMPIGGVRGNTVYRIDLGKKIIYVLICNFSSV